MIRKLKIMLLIIVNMNVDLFIVEQKEHQAILQGGFAINVKENLMKRNGHFIVLNVILIFALIVL